MDETVELAERLRKMVEDGKADNEIQALHMLIAECEQGEGDRWDGLS